MSENQHLSKQMKPTDRTLFTGDILTHPRESTGVTDDIHDGSVPFK